MKTGEVNREEKRSQQKRDIERKGGVKRRGKANETRRRKGKM